MDQDCNLSKANTYIGGLEEGMAKRAASVMVDSAFSAMASRRPKPDSLVDLLFIAQLTSLVFSNSANVNHVIRGDELQTGWEEVYQKLSD